MKLLRSQRGIAPLALLAAIALLIVGGSTTAVISDNSKPGDLLYGVDRAVESIQLAIATSPEEKAKVKLALALERLDEVEALSNAGAAADKIEAAIALYEQNLKDALAKASEAKAQGKDTEEVLATITENILRAQETLETVYNQVPEEAQPAIQKAQEVSKTGLEEASAAISGEKLDEIIKDVKQDFPDVEDNLPTDIKDKIQRPLGP